MGAPEPGPVAPAHTVTGDFLTGLAPDLFPAIVDVRERGAYALGHVPGAIPLPRGLLEVLAPIVLPGREDAILLCCHNGERSRMAAHTMKVLGYKHVSVLGGGFDRWRAEARPTERGTNTLGKRFGEIVAQREDIAQVSPDDLEHTGLGCGGVLVDVRSPKEYAMGHVPGAVNIPGDRLPGTVAAWFANGTLPRTVVVTCAGRTRGLLAAHLLRQLRVPHVYALRNGTMAWVMSGRRLARGSTTRRHALPPPKGEWSRQLAGTWCVPGLTPAEWAAIPSTFESRYVLDVRSAAEYAAHHIPGSLSIPCGQLANVADEWVGHRAAPVLCYSSRDERARLAANLLKDVGYSDVSWLKGGLWGWRQARLGVATGMPRFRDASNSCVSAAQSEVEAILPSQLLTWGSTVIDVRRSSEYAVGHLPGSVWIPRGALEDRIDAKVPDRDACLVVVSSRDIRSSLAARTLKAMGYRSVYRLAGGLFADDEVASRLREGLPEDVDALEAKEDVSVDGERGDILAPSVHDMERYIAWERGLVGDRST